MLASEENISMQNLKFIGVMVIMFCFVKINTVSEHENSVEVMFTCISHLTMLPHLER